MLLSDFLFILEKALFSKEDNNFFDEPIKAGNKSKNSLLENIKSPQFDIIKDKFS